MKDAASSRSVDISVVLSTRNRAEILRAALEPLVTQQTEGRFAYEILVVDNGSTDHTADVVKRYATGSPVRLRYLREERVGMPFAANTGIRHAEGSWLAFTEDDALVEPGWLSAIWRCAEETHAEAVDGPILPLWVDGRPEWMTDRLMQLLGTMGLLHHGRERLVADRQRATCRWGGGNVAIRRSVMARLGGFDERLIRTEDTELFYRYLRAGVKIVYEPSAVVYHKVGRDRLTPAFFRAWNHRHGYYRAYYLEPWRKRHLLTLFSSPWYRHVLQTAWAWWHVRPSSEASWERLAYEVRLRGCWSQWVHRVQLWPRWLLTVVTGRASTADVAGRVWSPSREAWT